MENDKWKMERAFPSMQITRVELKNIKNHAEAGFTFQPGVVAICGPNGSGKTTILEAIAWVIFDHLDYKRDDFVKRGTKRGQAVVGFISNLDGREYVVTRDTGGGYFVYDPDTKTRLVEQKNQVVPWLQQHIGVEPSTDLAGLFKTTIGVPQGTFTYDFSLTPSNRKSVFDQILKVDEYRNASDKLRDTLKYIDGLIGDADRSVAEAEGELRSYDETKSRHGEMNKRLKSMTAELKSAETKRDRAASESERFAGIHRRIEETAGLIERNRVSLDLKKASLLTARESADQAREAAEIVKNARSGHKNFIKASARLTELQSERQERDKLRQKIESTERKYLESMSRLTRSKDRLNEISDARENLAGLASLVDEQVLLEDRMASLRESRGEVQGLKRSLELIDRELEALRNRFSDFSRKLETAESYSQKADLVVSIEQELSRLDKEISAKELALGSMQVRKEHLRSLRAEWERLETERRKHIEDIESIRQKSAVASRLEEIESEYRVRTEKLAQIRAEVARDTEMIKALESGGVCPLLTEKCLNLKPGESLDERFRTGLDERRREIERLQSSLPEIYDALTESQQAVTENSRLQLIEKEVAGLSQLLDNHRNQIEALDKEITNGTEISPDEVKALKMSRTETESKLRESREAERVFSESDSLRKEMESITAEGELKKSDREKLSERIAGLGDIDQQMVEIEKALLALDDPRSRAKAFEQTVGREEEWRLEHKAAEAENSGIESDLEAMKTELKSYASLDAEIATEDATKSQCERDYQLFIANEKVAGFLKVREKEVSDLTKETGETEKALTRLQTDLGKLEKSYDKERHDTAVAELAKWRERSTQLTTELTHTRDQLDTLEQRLAYFEEVREKLQGYLARRDESKVLRGLADFIRDTLQKAAPYITESYLFAITNEANQLYREISGRHDVTLRWNREYEITIEEEGRERPFLNLSGGEQMAAALSVRLALLKELSEVNLAFFDEPTTNMDEERRRNLALQIGRIKDFQQLFIISHDDSFEGYTDQIIILDGAA